MSTYIMNKIFCNAKPVVKEPHKEAATGSTHVRRAASSKCTDTKESFRSERELFFTL